MASWAIRKALAIPRKMNLPTGLARVPFQYGNADCRFVYVTMLWEEEHRNCISALHWVLYIISTCSRAIVGVTLLTSQDIRDRFSSHNLRSYRTRTYIQGFPSSPSYVFDRISCHTASFPKRTATVKRRLLIFSSFFF